MTKEDYSLWVNYHLGNVKLSELNKREIKEIQASEFAMHLLVPTKSILKMIGGEGYLLSAASDEEVLEKLSEHFRVDRHVVLFKLQTLIRKNKIKEVSKRKVKSVNGNLIKIK